MRCSRLPTSSTDPRRLPRDLRATNRQDSTDAPAMVASSISRIKKLIFLDPSKCPIDFCGPLGNRMILKQSLLTGGLRKSAARRRRDRRDYWMAQVGAGFVDADSFSISALSERRSRAPFLAVAGRPGPRPRASAARFVPPWRRRPPPRAPRPRPAPRPSALRGAADRRARGRQIPRRRPWPSTAFGTLFHRSSKTCSRLAKT